MNKITDLEKILYFALSLKNATGIPLDIEEIINDINTTGNSGNFKISFVNKLYDSTVNEGITYFFKYLDKNYRIFNQNEIDRVSRLYFIEKVKEDNYAYLYTNYEFISKIIDIPEYEIKESIRNGMISMYLKLCYT